MALKHVGRLKTNQRKVIVAYRVVPGEPDFCICVTTENLDADYHDTLMRTLESDAGQSAYEFGEAMARTYLPDGRVMLAAFHTQGKMVKFPTNLIEMTPDSQTKIMLDELNKIIAEQKGVTVADLAIKEDTSTNKKKQAPAKAEATVETIATVDSVPTSTEPGILTDEDLAAQYRSQADALFKEAKRLREQAEELVPTKKKVAKTTESA